MTQTDTGSWQRGDVLGGQRLRPGHRSLLERDGSLHTQLASLLAAALSVTLEVLVQEDGKKKRHEDWKKRKEDIVHTP